MKYRFNTVRQPNLHFYRDSSGLEVDLVYPIGNKLLPIEIKAGQTIASSQVEPLERFARIFPDRAQAPLLVYGGPDEMWNGPARAVPVRSLTPHLRDVVSR